MNLDMTGFKHGKRIFGMHLGLLSDYVDGWNLHIKVGRYGGSVAFEEKDIRALSALSDRLAFIGFLRLIRKELEQLETMAKPFT